MGIGKEEDRADGNRNEEAKGSEGSPTTDGHHLTIRPTGFEPDEFTSRGYPILEARKHA